MSVLPVLTTRNSVLFPHVAQLVTVDRPRSLAAVEAALATEDQLVAVFAQHDAAVEDPRREHLYSVGTQAVIKQTVRSESALQVTLLGVERISLAGLEQAEPFLAGAVEVLETAPAEATEVEALQRQALELASRIQDAVQVMPEADMREIVAHLDGPMHLVYLLGSMITSTVEKAQVLLQLDSPAAALRMLVRYLEHELHVLELQQKISSRARSALDREQREYYLRQQLRAIQDELGEAEEAGTETAELTRRFDTLELPETVRRESQRELRRLADLPPAAPNFQVARAHLELIAELPWAEATDDNLDLAHVRGILEADHFGLDEVNERILEQLAVLKLNPEAKAPILCFVGPPGVGKTSLGSAIARALGRKFERIALGGLRDEAELRGHRRTYVGAMPGRLLQAIRRAGVRNPLLMLDEIDKVGHDVRGDPAAALLEILDPAQNHTFTDHYLGLPFDLSKVFFIATANALDTLPRPLIDRMETLHLTGYSDEDKTVIARRYLLPRRRRQAGLAADQLVVPDVTLAAVIRRYTREAGVRELERKLGRLARKAALACAEGRRQSITVMPSNLPDMLGPERFFVEEIRELPPPGVAAGLAWTQAGGEVLYIEAIRLLHGDQLILTGQLGEVMKESAQAARSYVMSLGPALGADLTATAVHIHVPAGAIPKDGPSAGMSMATALASLFAGLPVADDTAMTGEITLSGLVLPVGGVKEKVLAARRAGLARVILPKANEKDLRRLPEYVGDEIELILVANLNEALAAAIPGLGERLGRP